MRIKKMSAPSVVGEHDKAELKRLMAVFGLNGRKKTPAKPPSRTGATWRKQKPNESAGVCRGGTAREDPENQ